MQPVNAQFYSFLGTILIGMTMGILFDFYRIFRLLVKPKKILTYLGDLSFGFFAAAAVFILLLYSNWGEFRFYVFLGMAIGILFYYNLMSYWIVKGMLGICRSLRNLIIKSKKVMRDRKSVV